MKLETFFEKFDLFAEAPNAVGKLRELVLELAVTGRLIPSESAWPRRPLEVLTTKIGSGATPAGGRESYSTTGVPLIRSMNVYFGGFNPAGLVFLNEAQAAALASVAVQAGDVLLNITGASIGRVTTAPPEMAGARVNQHVAIIRTTSELLPDFLATFLAAPSVQRMIDDIQVGATRQALTKARIEKFEIPLPPLAEQARVLAKLDELMALCDHLEAQQREREMRRKALNQASLVRFADAPTSANLNFLFHRSFAVEPDGLEKAIQTLAIQGMLVPQDPSEGSAAPFLDMVASHKAEFFKHTRPRDGAKAPVPAQDEPFAIPSSWRWATFGEITINRDGGRIPVSKEERSARAKIYDYYGASGVIDKIDGYLFEKPLLLIGEDGANLLNRSTPIAFIARGKYWVNNHAHVVDGLSEDFLRYLEMYINAISLEGYVTGSAQPKMNQAKMNAIPVPVPPAAEQRRIVAQVDRLMQLVAGLRHQIASSHVTGARLLAAATEGFAIPT